MVSENIPKYMEPKSCVHPATVLEDSVHDEEDENAGIEVYDEFSKNGTLNE